VTAATTATREQMGPIRAVTRRAPALLAAGALAAALISACAPASEPPAQAPAAGPAESARVCVERPPGNSGGQSSTREAACLEAEQRYTATAPWTAFALSWIGCRIAIRSAEGAYGPVEQAIANRGGHEAADRLCEEVRRGAPSTEGRAQLADAGPAAGTVDVSSARALITEVFGTYELASTTGPTVGLRFGIKGDASPQTTKSTTDEVLDRALDPACLAIVFAEIGLSERASEKLKEAMANADATRALARRGPIQKQMLEISRAFADLDGGDCRRAGLAGEFELCRQSADLLRSAAKHALSNEIPAATDDVQRAQDALNRVRMLHEQARTAGLTASTFDAEREAAERETDPSKAIPALASLCKRGDDIACHSDGGCVQSRETGNFGRCLDQHCAAREIAGSVGLETFETCKRWCTQGLPGACATAAAYWDAGGHAAEAAAARARACQLGYRDKCPSQAPSAGAPADGSMSSRCAGAVPACQSPTVLSCDCSGPQCLWQCVQVKLH